MHKITLFAIGTAAAAMLAVYGAYSPVLAQTQATSGQSSSSQAGTSSTKTTTSVNTGGANTPAEDPLAAAARKAREQKKQAATDMQKKLDEQNAKIAQLSRELDLDQREYRLRAAAFYSDAGNRLRNAAQWDKDDASYKTDIEAKQKALDDAKAALTGLQEEARKAGLKENSQSGKESDKQVNDDSKKDEDKK